ncbi:MAG: hypothetical protein U1F08_01505 [Steroidobacteraceae bacterium]
MPSSIFDAPLLVAGPVILLTLCGFALAGLMFVRRRVLPRMTVNAEDSEFSGTLVQAVMVFYGLAVALIAVGVFDTYADVSKIVSVEAAELGAFYQDASTYPEPTRSQLQHELRDYARYVIEVAWPAQRQGQVARRGVEMLNRVHATLAAFEPATEGQRIVHAEALRAFNELLEARSLRLDAVVTSGLSGALWFLVLAGAAIGLFAAFFFRVEDVRLHAIQVTLLATFMGLVIFMIFAFDRPFRGDLGLDPEPYQLVYDKIMK